jgi:hypothetical protein
LFVSSFFFFFSLVPSPNFLVTPCIRFCRLLSWSYFFLLKLQHLLKHMFLLHKNGLWCPVYCWVWFYRFASVYYITYFSYLRYMFLPTLTRGQSSVILTQHVKAICVAAFRVIGHDSTRITLSNCSANMCLQPHDFNLDVPRPCELRVSALYFSLLSSWTCMTDGISTKLSVSGQLVAHHSLLMMWRGWAGAGAGACCSYFYRTEGTEFCSRMD